MLQFNEGTSDANFVVTLNEKKTLSAPYYLFVFEHTLTHDIISLIKYYEDDLSDYPERYNEFTLSQSIFTHTGQYQYRIYEQENESNTDEALATTLLEQGKAYVKPSAASPYETTYTTTDTATKAYDG